ncbi:MAG: hypothetical protein H7318_03740 [Oligoflexus sp.]|nr:hypothetical protein [Oligoflexus sp.]
MRYAALSLFVLICTNAFAMETSESSEPVPSKVYYRCESRGLDFDDRSRMKEVKPGVFTFSLPVSAKGLSDNCVISVMEDEGAEAELSFVDLFPRLSKNEAAVTGKSYSLGANHRLTTFKVDYKATGPRVVTFDSKSRTLRVGKSVPKVVAADKL